LMLGTFFGFLVGFSCVIFFAPSWLLFA